MSDIIIGIYQVIGVSFFLSMWAAAAMLLWRAIGVPLIEAIKDHETEYWKED